VASDSHTARADSLRQAQIDCGPQASGWFDPMTTGAHDWEKSQLV